MIKVFLRERLSWILLFFGLQLLTIFITYLDSAIALASITYIVFLSTLIFFVFLLVRYHQETKYYKSLLNWEHHLDITSITEGRSPFEKIIEHTVIAQTERLKQEAAQHLLDLQQEKDELLSWIHEVKTPLTAMQLMIHDLEDENVKAKLTYEWLRIHLLLDQQLHLKRIPFMENDLFIEQVDVKAIVFRELKSLQSWCMQKGIGFEIDLGVTEVVTDGKWLSFIIRQIVTNAVKYSKDADILITSYHKDGQTHLDITDFGRGIDSRDLPRIFEKGFTSTTIHQDNTATGMGLYLAKKVAKPLLIDISVISKLGKGTTFTLRFPKPNDFVMTGM
ncbi:sensor histidine kinase [Bacillus rubiinfantis]|uniref:sensor histidine kinase n=1 Tax=Bacillus rubiinfantis TaxID=1499680 RepID=UPI0005A99AB5|nr:sensor histidine kinase [Bacillus rubiinfantis]